MAATVKCPHCQKSFTIEGTGVTAAIRSFTREYVAKNPGCSKAQVFAAYYAKNPGTNPSTITTQIGVAFNA
jgi:hypothetical protein